MLLSYAFTRTRHGLGPSGRLAASEHERQGSTAGFMSGYFTLEMDLEAVKRFVILDLLDERRTTTRMLWKPRWTVGLTVSPVPARQHEKSNSAKGRCKV